ncbi:MAG: Cysteine synthase B [Verrucomicrobia subdivision 3 bacterium]|nr:Cysteine synthase B [Limisphaerales bacterium]MCS1415956.1 Cysteine synthase B [Limisphaerales bacterium]
MLFAVERAATATETQRRIGSQIVDRIGNTPLIKIRRVLPKKVNSKVRILVKAEWFNPGGSVKDRPAYRIVKDALASGALNADRGLIDSTSGNTGIAFAMIGAAMGFPVNLVMPSNVSTERKKILQGYGANIIYSDPLEGSDGARRLVKKLIDEEPGRYFFADQYSNHSNWKAHYDTTGPEIWRDTHRQVTHFVAGLGTSGTMMGTSRYLKEQSPNIKAVALQPEPFHGIEGWKNMDTAIPVRIYEKTVHDDLITVPTEPAYYWARELATKEGLLLSPSAGAALYGVIKVAQTLSEGLIVVIFADSGDKYLSTSLFQ